jgi:signal transduction histidine kinase
MKLNSIKFEISILYTAILGMVLIAFSAILYITNRALTEQNDYQLRSKAQAVDFTIRSYLDLLGENKPDALITSVQKTISLKPDQSYLQRQRTISNEWMQRVQTLGINKDYISFISRDGVNLYHSSNLDKGLGSLFLENAQFPRIHRITYSSVTYNQKDIRIINYPFIGPRGNKYLIQVGSVQEPIMQLLKNWLYSMAVSIPVILLLTSFVGRMLANRILEPVQEITHMARRITLQDLSGRIKAKNFDVEMGSLVEAFNDMIARLEKSFKHIEEFSYHVAHELKTPLTIIKGESELLLRKDRTKEEYQRAMRITIEETERVLKTIEDLLLLTKLDYQPDVFKFEQFDYVEFAKEVYEQTKIVAAKRSIRVMLKLDETQHSVMVRGDKLHLRRLFLNIMDNAIKFSPERGTIEITITQIPKKVVTSIKDSGPGIPQGELQKIFERFYRADNATVGNGLGLNISQTIAQIHEGEITVDSKPAAGATFNVVLPTL